MGPRNEVKMLPCPGHEGKCPFCKAEKVVATQLGKFTQVNRVTGEPMVGYCCQKCATNARYRKKFDVHDTHKLGGKVPTAEEVAKW